METETQYVQGTAAELLRTMLNDAVVKAAANAELAEMHATFCVDRAADLTCAKARGGAERRARIATRHASAWRKALSAIIALAATSTRTRCRWWEKNHE